MAFWFALLMIAAAFKTLDVAILVGVAPDIAVFAAGLSVLMTFGSVAMPELMWPWTRREYGRRLEGRIEQMNASELSQEIERCNLELSAAASAGRRTALVAWRQWLEAKRVERAPDVTPHRREQLTLRPTRRKLIGSAVCGGLFMAVGLWFILLAVVGGDGGTGFDGFRGPNAFWAKSIIGGLIVLVTAIPLVEAFTVRVDLSAVELRKRAWGRTLWSLPTANVALTQGDDGSWQVLDTRHQKRIGWLDSKHFEDVEFLKLIERLRPAS